MSGVERALLQKFRHAGIAYPRTRDESMYEREASAHRHEPPLPADGRVRAGRHDQLHPAGSLVRNGGDRLGRNLRPWARNHPAAALGTGPKATRYAHFEFSALVLGASDSAA